MVPFLETDTGVLYNGDSFSMLPSLLKNIENPVIVTDPPFNIGLKYNTYSDRMDDGEYYSKLAGMFSLCPTVCIHYPEALHRISIELSEVPMRVVSWVYPSNLKRQHRDIAFYRVKPDFERVRRPYKDMKDKRVRELFERTGGARSWDWVECNQVKNVSKEKTAHPCQMPLSLMRDIVKWISYDDITVVDPFAGSGTTLAACVQEGVKWVGIEMSAEYCDIIKNRIADTRFGG